MKMPLLCNLKHGTAVIIGGNKEVLKWAKILEDYRFDVEITYETTDEKEFLRNHLGKGIRSFLKRKYSSLEKEDREIDLIVTAKEDPLENDAILRVYGKGPNPIPFRGSTTPSVYANVSLPGFSNNRYDVNVGYSYMDNRLNRAMAQQLKALVNKNIITDDNYWGVAKLVETLKRDQNQPTSSVSSVKSMLKIGSEDLDDLIEQTTLDTLQRRTVIGVVDDPYILLEAKKFVEILKQFYPDGEFMLKVLKPTSPFYSEEDSLETNFGHLMKKSEENFQILSKALLNREIDFGFTDYMSSIHQRSTSIISILLSNQLGIEGWPLIHYACDNHVILNKQGITRIEDLPKKPRFVYDELNITDQIKEALYAKGCRRNYKFKSKMMDRPLDQYLRNNSKKLKKCFVTCSRANLNLFGFSDEVLQDLGFSIIQEHFATPRGFKDFCLLHRGYDLRIRNLISNDELSKALLKDLPINSFNKIFLEELCFDKFISYYKTKYSNVFMTSFECFPEEEKTIITISIQYEDDPVYKCQEFSGTIEKITSKDLDEIIDEIIGNMVWT